MLQVKGGLLPKSFIKIQRLEGKVIMIDSLLKPLLKKAKKGFRGYPVATIALYGPDKNRATKVAVGIVRGENAGPSVMEKWFLDSDICLDTEIGKQIVEFIRTNGVLSVVMTDGIIGCPHEKGIDYPEGRACPHCPFWEGRNRFSGEYES